MNYNSKILAEAIYQALIAGLFQHPGMERVGTECIENFCRERANNLSMMIPLMMENAKK